MHCPGMSFHFSPNDGISLIFAGPADARRPPPVEPASGGEKEDDALELDPGIGVPLGNGSPLTSLSMSAQTERAPQSFFTVRRRAAF